MKYLFLNTGLAGLCTLSLFGATITPGTSKDRHKIDEATSWTANESQTYTVSASASGCSFVDEKTEANGGATLTSHSSNSASAEKRITHTDVPNADAFGFSVSGILAGSGSGSAQSWSVTLKQKIFWLSVSPCEIVKAGTSVSVSANGAPTESTWSVNNREWKDHNASGSEPYKTSSIALNRNMWDKMKWTPDPVPTGYLFPPAGIYNVSATTTETSDARSAGTTVRVVEIAKPARNGLISKWDSSQLKYDCQVIKGDDLPVSGNWSGASDGKWDVSRGVLADKNKESTTFSHTTAEKGIDLKLFFAATGTEAIDSRIIDVYEDRLALCQDNFGNNRKCVENWTPVEKYGVKFEGTQGQMTDWNCFGSVVYFCNATVKGLYYPGSTEIFKGAINKTEIKRLIKEPNEICTSSALGDLQRGDVILYSEIVMQRESLLHAQMVTAASNTYAANNMAGGASEWKWYSAPAGEWANDWYKGMRVILRVYR